MAQLVSVQMTNVRVSFLTQIAFIRFLSRMNSCMFKSLAYLNFVPHSPHTWCFQNAAPSYVFREALVAHMFCCIQISPRKKLFFCVSPRYTPCEKSFLFAKKNKNHLFRRRFSPRNFAEKLHKSLQRNSATFRGDTL